MNERGKFTQVGIVAVPFSTKVIANNPSGRLALSLMQTRTSTAFGINVYFEDSQIKFMPR